jgi:hypothetical protein
VQLLRAFRDTALQHSMMGRLLIWFYYHVSPYPASVIERVPVLRHLTRLLLDRIVVAIERYTKLSRSKFRRNGG